VRLAGLSQKQGKFLKEQEANRCAQDLLISPKKYQAFIEADRFDEPVIQKFAKEVAIACGVIVGRLQHEKIIPFSAANSLKRRFTFREDNFHQ